MLKSLDKGMVSGRLGTVGVEDPLDASRPFTKIRIRAADGRNVLLDFLLHIPAESGGIFLMRKILDVDNDLSLSSHRRRVFARLDLGHDDLVG